MRRPSPIHAALAVTLTGLLVPTVAASAASSAPQASQAPQAPQAPPVQPQTPAAVQNPIGSMIWYALNQLGKPYQLGAAGPGAFDCSGLTSMSYRAAGISLPRVSKDQYQAYFTKVPISQVAPGDLVFWSYDTGDANQIHHVALAIGAGRMVAAPHTGTVVQIQSIYYSGLMGSALRPTTGAAAMFPVQSGQVSDLVRVVQLRLAANGYKIAVDGEFGPLTKAAVSDFQKRRGLAVVGYVGPLTWGELMSNGTMTRPTVTSPPSALPASPYPYLYPDGQAPAPIKPFRLTFGAGATS